MCARENAYMALKRVKHELSSRFLRAPTWSRLHISFFFSGNQKCCFTSNFRPANSGTCCHSSEGEVPRDVTWHIGVTKKFRKVVKVSKLSLDSCFQKATRRVTKWLSHWPYHKQQVAAQTLIQHPSRPREKFTRLDRLRWTKFATFLRNHPRACARGVPLNELSCYVPRTKAFLRDTGEECTVVPISLKCHGIQPPREWLNIFVQY